MSAPPGTVSATLSGVTGTPECLPTVSPAPVTAQVIMTLLFILAPLSIVLFGHCTSRIGTIPQPQGQAGARLTRDAKQCTKPV